MQADFRFTTRFRIAVAGLAVITAAACGDDYDDGPSAPIVPVSTVFTATADLTATLTGFRNTLGSAAADVTTSGNLDPVIMDDYILSEPVAAD